MTYDGHVVIGWSDGEITTEDGHVPGVDAMRVGPIGLLAVLDELYACNLDEVFALMLAARAVYDLVDAPAGDRRAAFREHSAATLAWPRRFAEPAPITHDST
jgi:hypothetical protein